MDRYKSLADRPYESDYLYVETIINHPVEKIWPHILDIGSWMSAHELQTLDGRSGEVGFFEKVLPRGMGEEVPSPHHHLYGIAYLIPYKYIALEVLPEIGGSYGNTKQWMSFDGILLTPLDPHRTKVLFLMVDVVLDKGDAEFRAQQEAKLRDGKALIEDYFVNLTQLVDAA